MLSALDFQSVAPSAPRDPGRSDVACFVGWVARRPGRPVPDGVRAGLEAGGWIGGPWARDEGGIDSLHQLPVTCDSWDVFDQLFDWNARPVGEGSPERGATWLGAAVRSFFACGGRSAVVIRVGDPWPFTGTASGEEVRLARLGAVIPAAGPDPRPFDPTDPSTWVGIEHLFGLPEVSHLCLPDLAEILAAEPVPLRLDDPPPPPPEVFVPCSVEPPPLPDDRGMRSVAAPRLDAEGYAAWGLAVGRVCDFLSVRRRDALLVTSLPIPTAAPAPAASASAEDDFTGATDWLGLFESVGALRRDPPGSASAFVQMVWPWIATTEASDLPEGLEPPEGLFAGVLARNALEQGTYRSVAGTRLPSVVRESPALDRGLGPDSPTVLLGERVSLIGPEPDGMTILSDVTAAPDEDWRPGGVSRLVASLLRRARRVGEAETFDLNGPALWGRLRRAMETVLEDHYRAGALRGVTPAEAFTVRCGPDTTAQNDLDAGRVRVEVSVLPAVSVERIVVSLELVPGATDLRSVEVV